MTRREVRLASFKLHDDYYRKEAVAKAELRFKEEGGSVLSGGLSLQAELSPELREKIRFMIEKELARQIGSDVETFSDGTVPVAPDDDDNIPF